MTRSLQSTVFGPAHDWGRIRAVDGTQQRGFEELCFQLRDLAPAGWETIKTAAPDGGVEWYDQAPDGRAFGWQAKFVDTVEKLIRHARKSVKTVGANRAHRNVVQLTFLAPFDLPDPAAETPKGRARSGARDKWNKAVQEWKTKLPGVSDIEIVFRGSGELLERLAEPGHEGRRWWFFQDLALGPAWCRQQVTRAERVANDRYTPARHVKLPVASILDGLALSSQYCRRLARRADAVHAAVTEVSEGWVWWLGSHGDMASRATSDGAGQASAAAGEVERLNRLVEQAMRASGAVRDAAHGSDARRGLASSDLLTCTRDLAGLLAEYRTDAWTLGERLAASEPAQALEEPAEPAGQEAEDEEEDPRRRLARDIGDHQQPRTPSQALRTLLEDFRDVQRATNAVDQLYELLPGDAARAGEAGAWLLLGRPGQGKTHLLLDATHRALDDGRLAVTVFGEELQGQDPLTEIARRLGLGDLSHQVLLQALDAAGATTNSRFLLIVDALNDADEPERWKTELPRLLALAADFPHVAVALSCRDTMRDVVLPADLDTWQLPRTVHPGFDGFEIEALEQYLRDVPHALPRTPLLLPAFSNPLFVKLYCDGLRARAGRSTAPVAVSGTQHRSAVFDTFVDTRADIICTRLQLDASTRPVHTALRVLAERMAATRRDVLQRDEARSILDQFAPGKTDWPNTMLGQLVTNGVLTSDRYHIPNNQPVAGVAFTYQAFSDDRIVRAALNLHGDDARQLASARSLPATSALRQWLQQASPNLQEAASVLLPELTGVELIDVVDAADTPSAASTQSDPGPSAQRRNLFWRLLSTLPLRQSASVTQRTIDLLNQAIQEFGLKRQALDAILAVTSEPDHPLNADGLHNNLVRLSRPLREAWWATYIYTAWYEPGPLHRLLRWAEQLPTPRRLHPDQTQPARPVFQPRRAGTRPAETVESPEPPAAVARLAATTLVWTLTSSHRFLRDRATKALVQLLLGYPEVLSGLLDRFMREQSKQVNDPYLFERLLLVAYGVVLRVGWAQPQAVGDLARQVLASVYGDPDAPTHASTHALLCDAAQGIVNTALRLGVIGDTEAAAAHHPHAARKPGNAPTEEQLESRFPRPYDDPSTSWGSLWHSLHGLGDFGHYEVRPVVNKFSRLPLDRQRPSIRRERRHRPPIIRRSRVPAFRASLPDSVQDTLGTPAAIQRLLDNDWLARSVLDDHQYQLLRSCQKPPPRDEQLFDTQQNEEWASRWIFARVAALGWTPKRFGKFDHHHGRETGDRGTHKAERIGKKYQWIALHELTERLANHYHPHEHFLGTGDSYTGAWQLLLRDLDPSLPPAPHPRSDDEDDDPVPNDERPQLATFPPAEPAGWWVPPRPHLPDLDGVQNWIFHGGALPLLEDFAVRTDDHGTRWVVLGDYASDTADGRGWSGQKNQAEQWHLIHSWLVTQDQFPAVFDFLKTRSLIPRWMPDARHPYQTYLGEFPSAPAAHDPAATDPDSPYELRFVDYDTADKASGRKRRRRQTTAPTSQNASSPTITLEELAARWSDIDQPHDDDPMDPVLGDLLLEGHADQPSWLHVGVDSSGAPLYAVPASQDYSWSASGADCSIQANIGVQLPNNIMLTGVSLIRHPDRPDWYDTTGRHIISYRWTPRSTGTIQTLLIREDWLTIRLHQLGYTLILGLIGERQTVTTTPRYWRQYSQAAGYIPDGQWQFHTTRTAIKRAKR
jgi:hypothetical protein